MAKHLRQTRRDVPVADHIARYCNPQRVIRDPLTGAIEGVYPQAFELRPKESYLSASWMEFFGRDEGTDHQFKSVVSALRAKHPNVKPHGAFARLNAGRILEVGSERGHSLRIRDRSSARDPGYASIENTPRDNSDLELLATFAEACCVDIRAVEAIDALSHSPDEGQEKSADEELTSRLEPRLVRGVRRTSKVIWRPKKMAKWGEPRKRPPLGWVRPRGTHVKPESLVQRYYLFEVVTGNIMAVSDDEFGTKLPSHPAGKWRYIKSVDLATEIDPGHGKKKFSLPNAEVVAAVQKDGYYKVSWLTKLQTKQVACSL